MRLKPEQIIIGIDTREQEPYTDAELGFPVKTVSMDTGDYSVVQPDLSLLVAIERKSLPDLVASVTQGRERFNREVQRLRAYRYAFLVVEGSARAIVNHEYRSKAHGG